MASLDSVLLGISFILLLSVLASKASQKMGVPALLLFLGLGLLAGEEGIGRIPFNHPEMARLSGIVALALILFSGGLGTDWKRVRVVFWPGLSLATIGVLLTAILVGVFTTWLLHLSLLQGLLLGAIVSSTDAAAVFAVLRSKRISLKGPIKPLLELESGSNDPMAVFLTVGLIHLILNPAAPALSLVWMFLRQMTLGALFGAAFGWGMVTLLRHLRLEHEGLYPVLTLSLAGLSYSVTSALGGSGFLAIYIAGVWMGQEEFLHRKTLIRFHDGMAWLMQIAMFLVLGLQAFPSQLIPITGPGLAVSLFLAVIARPVSVLISLIGSGLDIREKAMVAWVGLRGASPIVLATFPMVAGVEHSDLFFHLVFFISVTSVCLQGPSIRWVARWLGVDEPFSERKRSPLEFERTGEIEANLVEFIVPFNSAIAGRSLVQLKLPSDCLISLVCRGDKYLVPSGRTVLEEGDVLSILIAPTKMARVHSLLSAQKKP